MNFNPFGTNFARNTLVTYKLYATLIRLGIVNDPNGVAIMFAEAFERGTLRPGGKQ